MSATVVGAQSWESLKARAKGLKADLDSKMQELGRLHKRLSTTSHSATPGDRHATLEGQIQVVVGLREEVERGLSELEDTCEAMSRIATTSIQAAQAVRFRETHQEMVRDLKRVAESIDHQYRTAQLLPKGSGRAGGRGGAGDAEEGLMNERSGLNNSLSMCDEVIGQASATRDMLAGQRKTLTDVQSKVGGIESMLPGVGQLIDKISDQKTKERVVLSGTVACCLFFTIWYKFL